MSYVWHVIVLVFDRRAPKNPSSSDLVLTLIAFGTMDYLCKAYDS